MSHYQANQTLDCKGLSCPMPIVRTRKAIEGMNPGDVLHVEATDKGSLADMQSWAERTGHQYLGSKEEGEVLHHYIRKAVEGEEKQEKKHPEVIKLDKVKIRYEDPSIQLIDVREPMEYHFSHIPGAVSIPLGELESRVEELDSGKETWVICRSGNRSDTACQILMEKGFQNVKNVIPGMKDWDGPTDNS
ncbi:sulfurtransferase TusA family protein [Melghirimyces algeriensis]|uniref:Rhodanese-related sulfurtransferase n=1 Tax=Melghirimyces algeriensis TaxID=910412 RepID=A0A521EHZ1_9BACL|nr:sulfurtransferase TusA family protein [Melghirimyces algeriensis]SMO83462.1 Rhodanese-related sulfurtransferase [Melghirimyces algeriensis]